MADIAATSSTDITNERAGFISRIGSYFYGFQKVSEQPAFQRAFANNCGGSRHYF